ncbi:sugar phosphate permease [Filimonas zeae]|nr:hypothetical protein [Filimonas zeae]MDR6338682.1 sugar phosphate permease [Filimonas zeae]
MRFLPTKVHGMLDYLMGVVLMIPWILKYEGPAAVVASLMGLSLVVYSFMTNYELGGIKLIPMRAHLILDVIGGLFLAASPWLFSFDDGLKIPFLVAGIFELIVTMFTKTRASDKPNEAEAQKAREWKGAVTR